MIFFKVNLPFIFNKIYLEGKIDCLKIINDNYLKNVYLLNK